MRNRLFTGKAESAADCQRAAAALKKGGVVIHPTETVYGFAVNALMPAAVAKIDKIKGRRNGQTYIVLVKSIAMAERFKVLLSRPARKLVGKYWPGPLTLVLPVQENSPLFPMAIEGTIGLRISPNATVLSLFEFIDFPLVSTSVNESGASPLEKIPDITRRFGNEVDVILDGGILPPSQPSTIVKIVKSKVLILRQGAVVPVA